MKKWFCVAFTIVGVTCCNTANAFHHRKWKQTGQPAINPVLLNWVLSEGKQVIDDTLGTTGNSKKSTTSRLPPTTTVPKTKKDIQSLLDRLDVVNAKLGVTPLPAPTKDPIPPLTKQPQPPTNGPPDVFPN